ncbi:hypothetical protein [Pseudomonas phage PAShipCat1]
MSMELNKESVEQAGGDERAADAKPCATRCPDCGEHDLMPGDLCACGYETDPATGYACSECDGSGEGCVGEVCRECDGSGWFVTPDQASAALAQPSPTLPPFAEKVLTKLRRFNDCAEDFESGGVDIGRHWLDLLTQLGLLNRVQRSPALWEISQQGEDLLGTPQPSPASDLDPFNLAPHAEAFNEAPAEALKPEQAEAERPEVVAWQYRVTAGPQTGWSLWHPGKGEEFERSYTVERRPLMTVAQHERIVGELRAVIAQLRQHKNDYMDSGQETYRALQNEIREREAEIARLDGLVSGRTAERDAALARVAEMEKQEPVATVARVPGEDWNGLHFYRDLQGIPSGTKLYTAPVAQAQHSVPEKVRTLLSRAQCEIEHLAECLENVCEDEEYFDVREDVADGRVVAADIAHMLAAAPAQAQHSVPEGWKLVPIEPLLNMMSDKDHDTRITAERQLLSILADVPGNSVPQAWIDVQAERRRQITAEGWTPEHDDLYCAAELPRAAAAYILNGANDEAPAIWPFVTKWWKPRDARSNYVRAGALILAEIERLDRARQGGRS